MIKNLKAYNEITHYVVIARRYFINNFYDGMLTILGIYLGLFVFIVYDSEISSIKSVFIIFPSLGTSISMFISGVSGSYLSERAEQKKGRREIDQAMVILKDETLNEINKETSIKLNEEIQKAMITPININNSFRKTRSDRKRKVKLRRKRTIHEKAQRFSNVLVAMVNGTAPLLGGLVPSLPFFFIQNAVFETFLISFSIILICIVFLGIILSAISKESIIRNILEMVAAFLFTFLASFLLLRL